MELWSFASHKLRKKHRLMATSDDDKEIPFQIYPKNKAQSCESK